MDRMVSMRLPTDLMERVTQQARSRGWSRSDLIRRVLTAWCDSQENR